MVSHRRAKAWTSTVHGPRFYKKKVRWLKQRLSSIRHRYSNSNIRDLILALSWPYSFAASNKKRRFSRLIPSKLTLHGLFPDESTVLEVPSKLTLHELVPDQSTVLEVSSTASESESSDSLPLESYDLTPQVPFEILPIMKRDWPSISNKEDGEFWGAQWIKHGSLSGLSVSDYLTTALCLRKLFVTGLKLKKNKPMKAEVLVQSLKEHLQTHLNLHVTPQIKCSFLRKIKIPYPSNKILHKMHRRRIYVLKEIRLRVDGKKLGFVDYEDSSKTYFGCSARSLVVIPYIKQKN